MFRNFQTLAVIPLGFIPRISNNCLYNLLITISQQPKMITIKRSGSKIING